MKLQPSSGKRLQHAFLILMPYSEYGIALFLGRCIVYRTIKKNCHQETAAMLCRSVSFTPCSDTKPQCIEGALIPNREVRKIYLSCRFSLCIRLLQSSLKRTKTVMVETDKRHKTEMTQLRDPGRLS